MKGLYLGCDSSAIPVSLGEFSNLQESISLPNVLPLAGEMILLKNRDYSCIQHDDSNGFYLSICGWFLYQDQLNNIDGLFHDLKQQGSSALNNITDGVFIAIFFYPDGFFIFNDPMGLSNHYYSIVDNSVVVAPSVHVLGKCNLALEKNDLMTSFLNKRGHLFGSNTIYSNVFRMEPGSILDNNGQSKIYFDLVAVSPVAVEEIPSYMANLINLFPVEKRHLPISGGLDSRLMLSAGQFEFGYCYGPENSGDRPIARHFAAEFTTFNEFDFSAPQKNGNEALVYQEILEAPTEFVKNEFLASYRYSSNLSGKSNVIFDGFLGDVLQRGVYLHLGGLLGELYRFFPLLYSLKKLDAHFLMKRRYNNINDEEFQLLFSDFCLRTENLALDDYAKITYYEFMWGRGARFINNGALILNGQFGAIVPLFANPVIFTTLIRESFSATVRFNTVSKIWRLVDEKFKKTKFENGYKISTPNFVKPKLALIWRLLGKYVPGFENYGNSNAQK
jgi:hypothetical protein